MFDILTFNQFESQRIAMPAFGVSMKLTNGSVILAAIVAPNVIGRIDDAQVTRVQQDLRGIENAMKFYRLDNFAYPTSEQGLDALVNKPADPNIRNWKPGGYLDRLPKDPWGNPYQYLNPGQNSEIDIFSYGRDGRPGGEGIDADMGNWNLE